MALPGFVDSLLAALGMHTPPCVPACLLLHSGVLVPPPIPVLFSFFPLGGAALHATPTRVFRRLCHSLFFPQEEFQSMAAAMDGFGWRAERPDAADFVSQKWGYRGDAVGELLPVAVRMSEALSQYPIGCRLCITQVKQVARMDRHQSCSVTEHTALLPLTPAPCRPLPAHRLLGGAGAEHGGGARPPGRGHCHPGLPAQAGGLVGWLPGWLGAHRCALLLALSAHLDECEQ